MKLPSKFTQAIQVVSFSLLFGYFGNAVFATEVVAHETHKSTEKSGDHDRHKQHEEHHRHHEQHQRHDQEKAHDSKNDKPTFSVHMKNDKK